MKFQAIGRCQFIRHCRSFEKHPNEPKYKMDPSLLTWRHLRRLNQWPGHSRKCRQNLGEWFCSWGRPTRWPMGSSGWARCREDSEAWISWREFRMKTSRDFTCGQCYKCNFCRNFRQSKFQQNLVHSKSCVSFGMLVFQLLLSFLGENHLLKWKNTALDQQYGLRGPSKFCRYSNGRKFWQK